MRSFMTMWQHAFDFKGKTTVGEFVRALIVHCVVGAVLSYVLATTLGEEIGVMLMIGYSIVSIIPITAMVVRRVRDTERSMANLLWVFVPFLGWLIFLMLLLSKSRAQRDRDFDRYHW